MIGQFGCGGFINDNHAGRMQLQGGSRHARGDRPLNRLRQTVRPLAQLGRELPLQPFKPLFVFGIVDHVVLFKDIVVQIVELVGIEIMREQQIPLTDRTFKDAALIFPNINSRTIRVKTAGERPDLKVHIRRRRAFTSGGTLFAGFGTPVHFGQDVLELLLHLAVDFVENGGDSGRYGEAGRNEAHQQAQDLIRFR